ncbi:MAG: Mov34/MPN/PAD-1 family protein [Armatimonadota bacterium]|nr:Mov34/MPN/PAD-1 family protein [Armatimonadota bacterium]MCX7776958.1 Mov34/MPN/PAD-1 family protein [Armatimonadota bacterium]MDW8024792.1 Mov34/MPN/PAD-1 family protein [Armatimonadota bacterium]
MKCSNAADKECDKVGGQVLLSLSAYMRIKAHSLLTYPDECCGLLIGRKAGATVWEIMKAFPTRNAHRERKRDRYEIEPHTILTAMTGAKIQGLEWIGVYHSHPNVPPVPSLTDSELAWEGLIYLIMSVFNGGMTVARAWLYTGEVANGLTDGFAELKIATLEDAFFHASGHMNDLGAEAQIDLRDEVLPFNIIRAKEKLEQMQPGQTLSIIFNCERSLKQLVEALEDDGHYVLCLRFQGEHQWEALVKRGYKPGSKARF